MATSPSPLKFLPTSSSSPYPYSHFHFFLIVQPQSVSANSFRALRLKISCSPQTIEIGTQENSRTKKKRKPRPSFLDQIHEKWSRKTSSSREIFPWEEEKPENFEEIEENCQQSAAVLVSDCEKCSPVSSSSFISIKNVNFPPWTHGNKQRKSQFVSEDRELDKSSDEGESLSGNSVVLLEKPGDAVHFDEKFREKDVKDEDARIGLSQKGRTTVLELYKGDEYNGSASGMLPEFSNIKGLNEARRLPWQRESEGESIDGKRLRKNNADLAEKVIPEPELKRLRNMALRMVERIKVGAAGVTQTLVDTIHEKWKVDEVVKLKFEGPPAMNMRRTHEILERRTGGLVIWRSGSSIVLYRGMAYKLECVQSYNKENECPGALVNDVNESIVAKDFSRAAKSSRTDSLKHIKNPPSKEEKDLQELNLLLDELGPRFKDWSGPEPLPVDADLLPAVVSGYKSPFRLLPHGIRQSLQDKEMTYFRQTARKMPPHFALGRNRELQGLATAMVKLWERSAIAKIAIKRGVQNTWNERMAEELKVLTGGTLLSRNKDYIVFYRGNDFLPSAVAKELIEKERLSAIQQDAEEKARICTVAQIDSNTKATKGPLVAGTLAETKAATSRWANQPTSEDLQKMMKELAAVRHASLVKFLEKKLSIAKGKITNAEKALNKVQEKLEPAELPTDLEILSDEERFLFRKIGMSMKTYLLLGKREIFDGIIENMHLHWKYRELVKIMVKRKSFPQVKHIAIALEAESGGVLVSVEKTFKGYAIIVYRGKNYQRPSTFRPKNLLTKRQALARSIELQRREALKHHVSELQEKIEKLKSELEGTKMGKEIDEKTLYSRIDDASDDDDYLEGDEGDEECLENRH